MSRSELTESISDLRPAGGRPDLVLAKVACQLNSASRHRLKSVVRRYDPDRVFVFPHGLA